jgi:hypothetical protein
MLRTNRRFLLLSTFCVHLTACLPSDRLNSTCTWVNDPPLKLDLRDSAHRKHLEMDVRLAEDLGIRYGDAVGPRVASEENLGPRRECTEALLAKVIDLHGVGHADVMRATGARDMGTDVLTIFVPMLLLFGFAADRISRRVDRAFEPDEQWMKLLALVVLAPVVAGFAAVAADLWAWLVEMTRLRNGHISYRAFRLPTSQHRLTIWTIGMLVFGCVAAARELRRRSAARASLAHTG